MDNLYKGDYIVSLVLYNTDKKNLKYSVLAVCCSVVLFLNILFDFFAGRNFSVSLKF